MRSLRFILGDQLSRQMSSLADLQPDDVVLMVEVADEATYVPHHKQKLTFIFSAMRHFAAQLRQAGVEVDYVQLDDAGNSGSFPGELRRALRRHTVQRVVMTEPGEWRVLAMLEALQRELPVPLELRPDDRFLCSREEFAAWADGRKNLRMEFFYRHMRRRTGWLMENDEPVGERWNFDRENRKALPAGLSLPPRKGFRPDTVTRQVMELVEARFPENFGQLETFRWGVTRKQARAALNHFIKDCLPHFGDYQDAMKAGEPLLYHGLIAPYLNVGLLHAEEVCQAALKALAKEAAPLPAVEGFVRQILGWREFIRGVYWLRMPAYGRTNALGARRPLPAFYWTAETDMNCMADTLAGTRRHGYAHHIQRLMITGNFALLAGIDPAAVEAWYLSVYVDAFEWVELPNTHGMALFADGGVLSSKPYAASGSYVNRMSDYCRPCVYDPGVREGEKACPFNYLYWHFFITHEKKLRPNARLGMTYRNLDRMDAERRRRIMRQATSFLDRLEPWSGPQTKA